MPFASGNALFDPAFPLPPLDYTVTRGYHPGGDSTHSLLVDLADVLLWLGEPGDAPDHPHPLAE